MGREDGFTIVEMAVAVALGLIALTGVYRFADSMWVHTSDLDKRGFAQTEVREAMRLITSELRQAYTGDPADFPVDAIGPTNLTFISPTRDTPVRVRRIQYRIAGGELQRRQATSTDDDGPPWSIPAPGPWETVVRDVVAGSGFSARSDDGSATTDPDSSHIVTVEIVVDPSGARTPAAQAFETTVELRVR